MDAYRIGIAENPEQDARGIIGEALNEYNDRHAGDAHFERVALCLYDAQQQIVGGVIGDIYWNWLFVELFWIREDLRGQGYGGQLLSGIEEQARQRGARAAYLDTFSFQAPDFYKKHGYRAFGQLDNFPAGFQRIFFTKEL